MASFIKSFVVALVGAVAGNLLILFVFRPFVIIAATPLQPLNVGPVAVLTSVGVIAATLVYALMRKFLARPNKPFFWLSVVVLLLSFIPDIRIIGTVTGPFAGATFPAVIVLMMMHIFAATVIVFSLMGLWGPRRARAKRKPIAPTPAPKKPVQRNQMRF